MERMRNVLLFLFLIAAFSAQALPKKAPPKPVRPPTQNEGEFCLSGFVPPATDGVKIPLEPKFGVVTFDAADQVARLEKAIAAKATKVPLKTLLKDRDFVTKTLALDALRTAGVTNVDALVKRDAKYGTFLKAFTQDVVFMRLYAGAGLVPTDTDVGLRVMADIWARDGKSADFDKRLCAGIAAAWGAGPQSRRLQFNETLPVGDGNRCDPVWRYFFFRQSEREGRLHPNYPNLRPWEIRFLAGNSWDDESLWWLSRRINLPWDQYGWACWAAKYSGLSTYGQTIQGPLFYVQAPRWMGEAEKTVLHGGVCGALSHVGCHAAAAHGIPSYTVGQPGHCAYGFRLERGAWLGGFGGPDGYPHNWIFPGGAPTMTRLMERAFRDDRLVDRCVVLRAFWLAGVPGAIDYLARAWPHNYCLQQEYLTWLRDHNGKLSEYAVSLLKAYPGYGFAYYETVKPFLTEIESQLDARALTDYRLAFHRAIAATPPSWAAKDLPQILAQQTKGLAEADEKAFLEQVFAIHASGKNDQAFGNLLEWAIDTYVAKGRDTVFAEAFKAAAASLEENRPAGGELKPDAKSSARKTFAKAIVAAEQAHSAVAVNALTDLAECQGLTNGTDPDLKLTFPAGERLVSDRGLLSISTTSGWDSPIDHRNVLRNAPGQFHTDKEPTNWALVDLGETLPISTVMLVKNRGNEGRSRHMRVLRSTDGATFFPLEESENTPRIWSVAGQGAPARWIKVERISDEADFFHLRNILVFTKEGR